MNKFIIFISFLSFTLIGWSQGEEVGPLTGNPQLLAKKAHVLKINEGTFDSTFIYTQDTISLPVFDDFSSNKFQSYDADYLDAGVSSDQVFALLDGSNNPLAFDAVYTTQVTYRTTYTVSTSSSANVNFSSTSVQIGDLSSYPVIHVATGVYPPFYIYDTINTPADTDLTPDTVWLVGPDIYQDSATQFFAPVNDLSKIWMDSEAYHNYRYAVNPWSLGVATFDGLDEVGYPYDFGSAASNFADHLTSKPIDMSGVSASDSIYFSFLYETEGYGDQPESGDSLILEFYAHDLFQWNQVWSVGGAALDSFKIGHILLDNADYFKKGFQFRFKNIGGLSGSLDHFHLDYVNLRTLSGFQDTLFKDFAIVYPVNTLINDFTSVPWDHWKNNFAGKMSSDVLMTVRNSSNNAENNLDGSSEVFYSGTSEATPFVLTAGILSGGEINYAAKSFYESTHDFSTGYHFDETKVGASQTFDVTTVAAAQFPTFTGNDSTFTQQVFENYYSYDDGSAEQAYGITVAQGRLAIEYEAYEADSLIGMNVHWVPSVNDVSNKLFLLTVWADNGGVPGDTLYEDNFFFPRQPSYEYDRNIFTTYYLRDTMKLPISGKFYIGWRQFDSDRLNVGLDKNIDNSSRTFYSLDGGASWGSSTIPGSVMIRPIFSTEMDATLGLRDEVSTVYAGVSVYPNPSTDIVNIEVENGLYSGVQVFDLMGRMIVETTSQEVDLSASPDGVYIFKFEGLNKIVKIIKR